MTSVPAISGNSVNIDTPQAYQDKACDQKNTKGMMT
jgi:hypothetical protein